METMMVSSHRNGYGALVVEATAGAARTRDARAYRGVMGIVGELENGGADEHAAWTTGFGWVSKRKGTWEAVNVDLYGYGLFGTQALGVVQVRQAERNKYGVTVRKSYFLVGRNEASRRPFAHCVHFAPVQGAVRRGASPADVVGAALRWIWRGRDPEKVIRHGDCGLYPVDRLPAGAEPVEMPCRARLSGAHVLEAEELAEVGGRYYAGGARLVHLKRQHADAEWDGWAEVLVGRRERPWNFSRQIGD